jgi:hypothetical protein
MGKTKLPYPPCVISPVTEKPYPRHKWEIAKGADTMTRKGIVYYRVRCARCGFNDPNPPTH